MTRTRAERRRHARRIKANRKKYYMVGDGSPAVVGIEARTPCLCSCWMCNNQRKRLGQSIKEQRDRALYAERED